MAVVLRTNKGTCAQMGIPAGFLGVQRELELIAQSEENDNNENQIPYERERESETPQVQIVKLVVTELLIESHVQVKDRTGSLHWHEVLPNSVFSRGGGGSAFHKGLVLF